MQGFQIRHFQRHFSITWSHTIFLMVSGTNSVQKQPSRRVLRKRCFENMQQIYRRTPMPKCDFNKFASNFIEIALRHGCSPVNLLHIFKTPFLKNTSGRLLLTNSFHYCSINQCLCQL